MTPQSALPHPNRYRQLLLARKREVLRNLRKTIEDLVALKESEDDLCVSHFEFIERRITKIDCVELDRIEQALKRLDQGTYGLCEACGCPIPPGRLDATPWATSCGACKPAVLLAGVA